MTSLISRDDTCNNNTRDTYRASVCSKAVEKWSEDVTLEEKWLAVRSALMERAKEVLSNKKRHQGRYGGKIVWHCIRDM